MPLKKLVHRLALVLATLAAVPAQAAIVSMDYAGTLDDGSSINGTIRWDSTTVGTDLGGGGTNFRYALQSVSLRVGATDFSNYLQNEVMDVSQSIANQDDLVFSVEIINAPAPLDANWVGLFFRFQSPNGDMFTSPATIPGGLDFIDKATSVSLDIRKRDPDVDMSVTSFSNIAATPAPPTGTPTNDVPEPGSLLLVSLAGLALTATRRRRPLPA